MDKSVERIDATSIAIVRTYDAPAEIVYEAMTNPEQLLQWLAGTIGEYALVRCEKDLTAGGLWRNILEKGDGSQIVLSGRYLEVVEDRRISFTENFGDFRGEMIVTVDLSDCGNAQSVVTTKVDFATEAIREAVLAGGTVDESDGIYSELAAFVAAKASARGGN